jgi:tRNA pseudouridine38-40 synthase
MQKTIKLTIQYDGTAYCGWQEQPNGPSVQTQVELALAKILGIRVRVQSSGRTDAGVHAVAMPAVFTTDSQVPLKAFIDGLNSYLPEDIAIQDACEVPPDFRVIGGTDSKTYRYTIYNTPVRSPLQRRTSWNIREPLDIPAMRQAAGYFVGEHDFAAFRASNCSAVTSRRRIDAVQICHDPPFVTIDVTGGGFLKHMVRIMVGTMVDIGKGRFPADHIRYLLDNPDRSKGGATAPPQGLCLIEVRYPAQQTAS